MKIQKLTKSQNGGQELVAAFSCCCCCCFFVSCDGPKEEKQEVEVVAPMSR